MAKEKESLVSYEVAIEPEDMDFHGNCSAIDAETDRAAEQWIADELARGNELAWCWVKVVARFEDYKGEDSCGGCSYKSRADLDANLIPNMKAEARAVLRNAIEYRTKGAVRDARKEARIAKIALAKLDKEGV
jgi:Rad3-related DNA helicase